MFFYSPLLDSSVLLSGNNYNPNITLIIPLQTITINSYSNSAQTLFSVNIPSENIAIGIDSTINITSYNVMTNVSNTLISIPSVNVNVTINTTANTYTQNITKVSDGSLLYTIVTPFINYTIH